MVAYNKNYRYKASSYATRIKANNPVKKAITKYKRANGSKPVVQKVANNRNAIMTLAKQVRNTQLSQLGDYQQCQLRVGFQPQGIYNQDQPVVFAVNDFCNGYTTDVGPPIFKPNGVSPYIKHTNFVHYDFATSYDHYNYWFKSRNNTASKNVYSPISTTMDIQIHKNMLPTDEPLVVRIDIVKQKKVIDNNIRNLMLPWSGSGLWKLCHENTSTRQKINPEFLQIITTKYIYMNNRNGSSNSVGATSEIRKSVTIHLPFDRKYINVDSEAEHSSNNELDFYQNVDPTKQIFCIMSFSSNSAMASTDINIRKVNRWRDQHGTD